MKKRIRSKTSGDSAFYNMVMNSPSMTVTFAVIVICAGLFLALFQSINKPIRREEAVAYSGTFERYEVSKNSRKIVFGDGSCYSVYPHTEKKEFRAAMESLDKGTKLYILVNPNNDCVIQIKTDTEELLNFEEAQAAIDKYDDGYIFIGISMCVSGILIIPYPFIKQRSRRKEAARRKQKRALTESGNTPVIRRADINIRNRILLETEAKGFKICYRRVRFVNELVVNGNVYDEVKAVLEFEHKLYARLDGHSIEAGCKEYGDDGYSYIRLDGKTLECKKRLI